MDSERPASSRTAGRPIDASGNRFFETAAGTKFKSESFAEGGVSVRVGSPSYRRSAGGDGR
jgi:hypothetical protein